MSTTDNRKKVLIITYYWPPSGGSGVQRWLKFVKYLPQFGWTPYVYTPENPSFSIQDESLLKNVPSEARVIKRPIWEPYEIFQKIGGLLGNKKVSKPTELVSLQSKSFFQRLSTWIRANLFFPDPRIFWKRPSVNFLYNFLKNEGIDIVITTGPPHSMHLIGYDLKRKNKDLKWVADFRDPWTRWDFLDTLQLSDFAKGIHQRLELKVLKSADAVISVTPSFVKGFESIGNRSIHLLTNGYDEDDFKSLAIRKSEKFIIRHVGIVNEKCDPRPFMLAVKKLVTSDNDFARDVSVEFNGEVHPDFKKFVNEEDDLKRITIFTGNISHREVLNLYGSSGLLLLVMTGYKDAGIIPGKLFEYFATGLPLLCVGPPDGDAAILVKTSGSGHVVSSDDEPGIIASLQDAFTAWKKTPASHSTNTGVLQYSRKKLTLKLTQLLDSLRN